VPAGVYSATVAWYIGWTTNSIAPSTAPNASSGTTPIPETGTNNSARIANTPKAPEMPYSTG